MLIGETRDTVQKCATRVHQQHIHKQTKHYKEIQGKGKREEIIRKKVRQSITQDQIKIRNMQTNLLYRSGNNIRSFVLSGELGSVSESAAINSPSGSNSTCIASVLGPRKGTCKYPGVFPARYPPRYDSWSSSTISSRFAGEEVRTLSNIKLLVVGVLPLVSSGCRSSGCICACSWDEGRRIWGCSGWEASEYRE